MGSAELLRCQEDYVRALRCLKSDNLQDCLRLCSALTESLNDATKNRSTTHKAHHLRRLVWTLKIKALANDYDINQALLLDEDDVDDESTTTESKEGNLQFGVIGGATTALGHRTGPSSQTALRSQRQTAILTGRPSSKSSRQTGRVTTSYRPLTTSLTATQTAFSRSTRPLLKYSTEPFLSKVVFHYLYNAQLITNKCPDYRQCLEYLNLVSSAQSASDSSRRKGIKDGTKVLVNIDDELTGINGELDVYWLLAYGACYFSLHMNKRAEEYFRRACTKSPKHVEPYAWLVKTYLRLGQPKEVLETCKLGLSNNESPILFNWLGRAQSLMGDWMAAQESLRSSLKCSPTDLEALANVGHFAFYDSNYELALKCFQRIEQLLSRGGMTDEFADDSASNTSRSELYNNLALCKFHCGDYDQVVNMFDESLSHSPDVQTTSDIWYNMSFVPLGCGFFNLAKACLKLSLASDPQNEMALNNLGVLTHYGLISEEFIPEEEVLSEIKRKRWATAQADALASDNRQQQLARDAQFDDAESYFSSPRSLGEQKQDLQPAEGATLSSEQPEMLHNMALVKYRRGQFLAALNYCNLYSKHDPCNEHILSIMRDIQQLILDDC